MKAYISVLVLIALFSNSDFQVQAVTIDKDQHKAGKTAKKAEAKPAAKTETKPVAVKAEVKPAGQPVAIVQAVAKVDTKAEETDLTANDEIEASEFSQTFTGADESDVIENIYSHYA